MGFERYIGANNVGETYSEEIGLTATRGSNSDLNESTLNESTKASVMGRQPWLNFTCMALLVHLLLLFLLTLSWEKAEIRLGADTVKASKKVSAYFITRQQLTQLMANKTLKPKEEINQAIMSQAQLESEVMLGTKTNATQVSVSLDDGIHRAIDPQTKVSRKSEASNQLETQTKPSSKHVVPKQAEIEIDPSSKNKALKQSSATDTLSATGDYLRRQQQQAFEQMVSEYGHRASMPSGASLSEMTPEMPRYEVKTIEDKIQPTSLNHRLDPNRIVKVGDTCYRVVNLSTQINPYGEGLGFARPCNPLDPTKRALDAAISHRLSKMKSN